MPKMTVTNNHTAPVGVRADEAETETPWVMLKPGQSRVLHVEDDEVKRCEAVNVKFEAA